jgi:hypothetical protein
MRPRIQRIAIAAFALSFAILFGGAQPAHAACNDDVTAMQAQLGEIKDEATKKEVQEHLEAAAKAAMAQDEGQCKVHFEKAKERAAR